MGTNRLLRSRAGVGVLLLTTAFLGLNHNLPAAYGQAPPAGDISNESADNSPAGLIELIKKSPKPDAKLIAALENYLSVTTLPAEAATTVAPILNDTELDSDTLFKMLALFGSDAQYDGVAAATMVALARNADKEVADPAKVEPILRAILKTQPIMSKVSWHGSGGGGRLKTYGELLAVYVDHCPKENEALTKKLADIEIRQITAARFTLDNDKAIERVNAIDPAALTREKDRDQLDYLKIDIYQRAKQPEKSLDAAKALWARPDSEFRSVAWPVLFEDLRSNGKLTEAGALLDEAASQYSNSTEMEDCRHKLAETAATQPAGQ